MIEKSILGESYFLIKCYKLYCFEIENNHFSMHKMFVFGERFE